MKTYKLKPSLIAVSVCLAIGSAHCVQANDKVKSKVDDVEVIEVTGIKGSLSEALNNKRFSDQAMDAISAEDVGKLPDNNIAEAIQRISGVSIQREFGEGSQVSVRGIGASLNNVTVNGKVLATTQQGRSFNFSSLGSELVSALEVFKSPLASQEEGSLGGTINLVTKGALDKKDNQKSVSLSYGHDQLTDHNSRRFSSNFNKHISDTFGITASINYLGRNSRSDIFGATAGWVPFNAAPKMLNPNGNGKYIPAKDLNGNKLKKGQLLLPDGTVVTNPLIPRQIQYQLRNGTRKRIGGNLGFHFQPSDKWDIKLDSIYSKLEHDDLFGSDQTRYDQQFAWTNIVYDRDLNAILSAETNPHAANKRSTRVTWTERLMEEETLSTSIDIKYLADNYTVEFSTGQSRAHKYDIRTSLSAQTAMGSSYDFTVDNPYYPKFDYNRDNSSLTPMSIQYPDFTFEDENEYAQLDFNYELDNDYLSSYQVGVKITNRTKDNSRYQVNIPRGDVPDSTQGYVTNYPVENFLDYLPSYLNPGFLYGLNLEQIALDFPKENHEPAPKGLEIWEINETYKAAYFQANIDWDRLRGNIGVRYVKTEVDSAGFNDEAMLKPTFATNSYDDILPSINLVYALEDNVLIRSSIAKVMARPSFKDLNSSGRIQEANQTAAFGNPNLDPYRADQFDLGIEYYFDDYGMVSASIFYKSIESFIYNEQFLETIDGYLNEDGELLEFTVTRPNNGTGGKFKGIEFSWQQDIPFIDGAGFVSNFTFSDSETELTNISGMKLPMEGVSKRSANIVLYYENDNIESRITWNYRDSFMAKAITLSGSPLFTKSAQYVDASIRYKFNKQYSLGLEMTNLTEQKRYQYAGDEQLTYAVRNDTGRTFAVNFRAKF